MLQRLKLCITTRVKKMQEAFVGVVARDIVADHAHVRFVQAENGIAICTLLLVITNAKEHSRHGTTLRLLVVVLHVNVRPLAQNGVVQHDDRIVHNPPFSFDASPFCFFCFDSKSSVSYTKLYRNSTFLLYTTADPYA